MADTVSQSERVRRYAQEIVSGSENRDAREYMAAIGVAFAAILKTHYPGLLRTHVLEQHVNHVRECIGPRG